MSDLSARRAAVVVTPRNITATVAVVAGGCAAAAAASRAVNERPNTDMEQSQTMGFVALCLSLLLTVLALSPALMSPAESRAGSASRHAARTLCFFWYWQPRQWVDLGPWWHSDLLNVSGLALSTPLRTAWLAASAWVFVSAAVILSTAVSWQPTPLSSCLIGTAPLDILLLASGISLSLAMPLGAASLRSRSAAAKEVVLAQEPAPASLFEKRRHGWLLALGMVMLWAGLRALGVVLQHAWLDQGSAALRTGVVVLAAAAEVGSFAALHGALPSSVSGAPALVRGTILLLVVLDCVALAMFGADALPLIRTLHSFALGAAVPGMQLHSSIVAWDQLHSQETRASVTVFGEQYHKTLQGAAAAVTAVTNRLLPRSHVDTLVLNEGMAFGRQQRGKASGGSSSSGSSMHEGVNLTPPFTSGPRFRPGMASRQQAMDSKAMPSSRRGALNTGVPGTQDTVSQSGIGLGVAAGLKTYSAISSAQRSPGSAVRLATTPTDSGRDSANDSDSMPPVPLQAASVDSSIQEPLPASAAKLSGRHSQPHLRSFSYERDSAAPSPAFEGLGAGTHIVVRIGEASAGSGSVLGGRVQPPNVEVGRAAEGGGSVTGASDLYSDATEALFILPGSRPPPSGRSEAVSATFSEGFLIRQGMPSPRPDSTPSGKGSTKHPIRGRGSASALEAREPTGTTATSLGGTSRAAASSTSSSMWSRPITLHFMDEPSSADTPQEYVCYLRSNLGAMHSDLARVGSHVEAARRWMQLRQFLLRLQRGEYSPPSRFYARRLIDFMRQHASDLSAKRHRSVRWTPLPIVHHFLLTGGAHEQDLQQAAQLMLDFAWGRTSPALGDIAVSMSITPVQHLRHGGFLPQSAMASAKSGRCATGRMGVCGARTTVTDRAGDAADDVDAADTTATVGVHGWFRLRLLVSFPDPRSAAEAQVGLTEEESVSLSILEAVARAHRGRSSYRSELQRTGACCTIALTLHLQREDHQDIDFLGDSEEEEEAAAKSRAGKGPVKLNAAGACKDPQPLPGAEKGGAPSEVRSHGADKSSAVPGMGLEESDEEDVGPTGPPAAGAGAAAAAAGVGTLKDMRPEPCGLGEVDDELFSMFPAVGSNVSLPVSMSERLRADGLDDVPLDDMTPAARLRHTNPCYTLTGVVPPPGRRGFRVLLVFDSSYDEIVERLMEPLLACGRVTSYARVKSSKALYSYAPGFLGRMDMGLPDVVFVGHKLGKHLAPRVCEFLRLQGLQHHTVGVVHQGAAEDAMEKVTQFVMTPPFLRPAVLFSVKVAAWGYVPENPEDIDKL